jgi:hypothetical protein
MLQGFVAGSVANIVLNDRLGFGKVRDYPYIGLPSLESCRLLPLDRLHK